MTRDEMAVTAHEEAEMLTHLRGPGATTLLSTHTVDRVILFLRAVDAALRAPAVTGEADRGSWPSGYIGRAFVAGASWWQFFKHGSTPFPSERDEMEAEAVRRYGDPAAPPAAGAPPALVALRKRAQELALYAFREHGDDATLYNALADMGGVSPDGAGWFSELDVAMTEPLTPSPAPAPVAPPAETGIDWSLTHERCPQCGDTDKLGGIMSLRKDDGSRWCLKCKVRLEAFAPADARPAERDGVRVTKAGHAWPDVPGGVAKDHARAKQPAIAYACLYQRLAQVAREHGYALAMHGSLMADLDLVAVPWTTDAVSDTALAAALAAAAPGSLHEDQWTGPRPGGVKKHIIHLGGGPYLDLCVTPRASAAQEAGDNDDDAHEHYENCESCEKPITGRVVRTPDDVPLCEACAAEIAAADPSPAQEAQ